MKFTGERESKKSVLLRLQDKIFFDIFNESPDENKRYKRPFGHDKKAGCRVKYKNEILYFVDNAKTLGKLSFNMIDLATIVKPNLSNLPEIKNFYNKQLKIKFLPPGPSKESFKFKIIANTTLFTSNNNPFKKYGLKAEDLNSDPETFLISSYWCNSKTDSELLKNRFGSPKKEPCIGYKFNNKWKLYFCERENFKWYSNLTNEIFNSCYLENYNNKYLVITKSKKDALILHFVFGVQCIAFQNEGVLPDIDLSRFKKIFILYDNDETGRKEAQIAAEKFNASKLFYKEAKDTGEMILKFPNKLKKFIKNELFS
jgi:hypothetical protein